MYLNLLKSIKKGPHVKDEKSDVSFPAERYQYISIIFFLKKQFHGNIQKSDYDVLKVNFLGKWGFFLMLKYWLHNANDLEVFDAFQRSLLLVHSICCLIMCIRCFHETGPKGLELCQQHVFAFDIPFFTPEWASYFKNWPFIFCSILHKS